jgi:hypothetical protein
MTAAQKLNMAFMRIYNLFALDFVGELYETVYADAPPDPTLAIYRQRVVDGFKALFTRPEDLAAIEMGQIPAAVNYQGYEAAENRVWNKSIEFMAMVTGLFTSGLHIMSRMKYPYVRMFNKRLAEEIASDPATPLAARLQGSARRGLNGFFFYPFAASFDPLRESLSKFS